MPARLPSPSMGHAVLLTPPKSSHLKFVTSSPTLRLHKSFSCNTYGSPRKCCKQKTYGRAKSFRCNTYKKPGGGGILPNLEKFARSRRRELAFHSSSFFSHCCALFWRVAHSWVPHTRVWRVGVLTPPSFSFPRII